MCLVFFCEKYVGLLDEVYTFLPNQSQSWNIQSSYLVSYYALLLVKKFALMSLCKLDLEFTSCISDIWYVFFWYILWSYDTLTPSTGSKWLKTCLLRQCSNFSEAHHCVEGIAKLLWSLQFKCASGHTFLEVLIM